MSILPPVYFLPACIASYSNTLIEVLLLFIQLHAVVLQHQLQKFYRSSLEGKHQHHVAYVLLLQLLCSWL